jgi:hypothetical protein
MCTPSLVAALLRAGLAALPTPFLGRLSAPLLLEPLLAGHHCFVTAACRPPNCVSAHDVVALPSLSGAVLLLSRSHVGMSLLSAPSPRRRVRTPAALRCVWLLLCHAVATYACRVATPCGCPHMAICRCTDSGLYGSFKHDSRAHAALPSCCCLACVLAPSSPCFCRSRAVAAVLYCSPSLICSMLFAVTMLALPHVPLLTPPAAAAAPRRTRTASACASLPRCDAYIKAEALSFYSRSCPVRRLPWPATEFPGLWSLSPTPPPLALQPGALLLHPHALDPATLAKPPPEPRRCAPGQAGVGAGRC